MGEHFDFPKELRCDSALLEKTHPYTADMLRRSADEIERLYSALGKITKDPPPTLDEPDTDCGVIQKYREIASEALGSRPFNAETMCRRQEGESHD